jgi:hypothetical protein
MTGPESKSKEAEILYYLFAFMVKQKRLIPAANRSGVREVFDYRYFPYSGRIAWTGPLAFHSP